MDILTHTASLLFIARQHRIEQYTTNAALIQQYQLKYLLQTARHTVYGEQYDFKHIHNYTDFSERVPLCCYDDLKPFIHRMINGEKNVLWPSKVRWYAKSSGTTSDKSKFIPVTSEILRHCHYQGGFDTVALYLRNTPESRFFSGKGLILGGSHRPSSINKDAHQGDLSAVLLQNLSRKLPIAELIRVPSKRIILMNEWESKIKAIVESSYNVNITNLSGVPSWMLVLIKAVLQYTGKSDLSEVWPNLEVFFHGGISFEPYREQYKSLISSSCMHYMETYNASEGFFGLQDNPHEKGLLTMLDYGIFYEFIPIEELEQEHPHTLPIEEVEIGKNYAMAISTVGGLWRYLIGDTVRFTSKHPYRFVIAGRTKNYINAFGEELMVDNADKAIAKVCHCLQAKVKEYTAAPRFLLDKAKGYHQWFIEFEQKPNSIDQFETLLDTTLQQLNSDYEAKRYKDISLLPLRVHVVHEGTFYQWMAQRGKVGGQHKIPRLFNNCRFLEELSVIDKELTVI